MQELETTWGRVISIWWLIAWRAGLGALAFGFVIGFIIGFVGVLVGAEQQTTTAISTVAGFIAGSLWGIAVIRMALRKKYRDFRIALVPA